MNSISDISAMLQSPEFQERFEDVVRGTARRNHSYIVYVDTEGRTVRDYPATEEVFEINANDQTLTLLSLHGAPVGAAGAVVVPATPQRFPQPVLVAR
jgi:hypothetical protein